MDLHTPCSIYPPSLVPKLPRPTPLPQPVSFVALAPPFRKLIPDLSDILIADLAPRCSEFGHSAWRPDAPTPEGKISAFLSLRFLIISGVFFFLVFVSANSDQLVRMSNLDCLEIRLRKRRAESLAAWRAH